MLLRRRLSVLVATALMLAMTLASGVALADPGKGQGAGQGIGGGDAAHVDNGNHLGTAKGEGLNNNPHSGAPCGLC